MAKRRRVAEIRVGEARDVRLAEAMKAFWKTEPLPGLVMLTKGSAWT